MRVQTGSGTATGTLTINGITRTVLATSTDYVYSGDFTLTQGSYNSTVMQLTVAPSSGSCIGNMIIEFVP